MAGPLTVSLAGDATIFTVAAHHQTLVDAFRNDGAIDIDLSGIGLVDVSFVQLIVSACKTAARQNRPLAIAGLPDTLRSAFERSGFGAAAESFSFA